MVAPSLTRIWRRRQPKSAKHDGVKNWTLWSLPRTCLAWLLLTDLTAVGTAVYGVVRESGPTTRQWILFAVLAIAATLHLVFTRPTEERQRAARLSRGKVEHVDQTSIWFFSASLLLPVTLVVALVVLMRTQRYRIARRPPSRWVFNSSAILLSALGVHWVGITTGLSQWLQEGHVRVISEVSLVAIAGVLAGVTVYFVVQAVLVGVYRGLMTRVWTFANTLGSRSDNIFIVYTLLLAVLAAVVAGFAPLLLGLMAVVAIRCTRDEHRKSQLAAEREQAELDALHDAKTGLLNARGFGLHSEAALAQDNVLGQSSAFLMCDLDHFKHWNTRLGHVGADLLLRAVADTVRAHVRPSDLVSRWGGEEIAVLLPNTDVTRATDVAERLRSAVEHLTLTVSRPAGEGTISIPDPLLNIPHCTISIGVAVLEWEESDRPATELLERVTRLADDAMYVAKATGRNRVCRADGIPIQSVSSPGDDLDQSDSDGYGERITAR